MKKESGEADKKDCEETESVKAVNSLSDGKEDLVVLVKASPAIVIDPGEKGEHSGGSLGLEPKINSRSQKIICRTDLRLSAT